MDRYAQAGVDYNALDPVKVMAQTAATSTATGLNAFGAHELSNSRGESAYLWEEADAYRALVIEGLGSKNLIADEVRKFTGKTYYDSLAQDTVAMIVNDLIVCGALPQVVNAYFAVGDSNWMRDTRRVNDLINGWAAACLKAGAVWGGGETPTLKGIVSPGTIDLAGSAVGLIKPKERLVLGDKLAPGDEIILVESSGLHANGITFVRTLAKKSPDIYKAKLPGGRLFGEAILTPTHLYVNLVRDLMEAEIDIHYMVNITGHGWRKLMRAAKELKYVVDNVPPVPPEFLFIQVQSGADEREMYANFNMGAGFAIYVPKSESQRVIKLAAAGGLKAWAVGKVENGIKEIVIRPKNIIFKSNSLVIR